MHKNANGSNRIISSGSADVQPFKITNRSQQAVSLTRLRFSHNTQNFFSVLDAQHLPVRIDPGYETQVSLQVQPIHMGVLRTTLFFDFESPQAPAFSIGRLVTTRCGNRTYEDIIAPTRPYERNRRRRARQYGPDVIEGERPPGTQDRFKVDLGPFAVPQSLRQLPRESLPAHFDGLRAGLPGTYAQFFSSLLWVEEMNMEVDIRAYDMDRARMRPEGRFLALDVPGLAESRPSVLRGDMVLATPSGRAGPRYRGYAHRVELERVLLRFSEDLHSAFVFGQEMDVSFTFRRTPLQLMHHGVSHPPPALAPQRMFPDAAAGLAFLPPQGEEHLRHLTRPARARRRAGAGKTVAMVEAVLELRRHTPEGFRLLVAAPSNTAADHFVELLRDVPPSEMLRLMAYNRDPRDVSPQARAGARGHLGSRIHTHPFPQRYPEKAPFRTLVRGLPIASDAAGSG
jgi:helicase MOV-10